MGGGMDKYKHMAYTAGAEEWVGDNALCSHAKAMLFQLAGDEVVHMEELRWGLVFATDADAAAYAAKQCRPGIDADAAESRPPRFQRAFA